MNLPSYIVKPGDVIALTEKSRSIKRFDEILDQTSGRAIPKWLSFDEDKMSVNVVALPTREDIDYNIEEHLIVELYSK